MMPFTKERNIEGQMDKFQSEGWNGNREISNICAHTLSLVLSSKEVS